MQLKPEALNALKLPIKVKAGFLGSVKLKVRHLFFGVQKMRWLMLTVRQLIEQDVQNLLQSILFILPVR